MQLFKNQPERSEDEVLLRTAIDMFEQDKKASQNQRTAEQVLAELEIPVEYLDRARAELLARESLKSSSLTRPARTRGRLVAILMAATLVFFFVVAAVGLVHFSAPAERIQTVGISTMPASTGGPPIEIGVDVQPAQAATAGN